MGNYETVENSLNYDDIVDSLRELVFIQQKNPDSISTALSRASQNGFSVSHLLDDAAKKELSHLHNKKRHRGDYPSILYTWKGDATKGTDELLSIANGYNHPDSQIVQNYQDSMRSKLPSQIPLVRGGGRNSHALESWSAKVGVARRYSNTQIDFTVVPPENVFMCSMYGPQIGEQEFTLTEAKTLDTYRPNTLNHIKLYQRMDEIL